MDKLDNNIAAAIKINEWLDQIDQFKQSDIDNWNLTPDEIQNWHDTINHIKNRVNNLFNLITDNEKK